MPHPGPSVARSARSKSLAPCEPWVNATDPTPELCHGLDDAYFEVGTPEHHRWSWALTTASQILWAKSGRRFGYCRVQERPSYPGCGCECSCPDPCDSMNGLAHIRLSRGPVSRLHSVWIDGIEQPIHQYAVANYRELVRLDGGALPQWNDLSRPARIPPYWQDGTTHDPTELCGPFDAAFQLPFEYPCAPGHWEVPSAGTFEIEYSHGKPVPELGRTAVVEYARELV